MKSIFQTGWRETRMAVPVTGPSTHGADDPATELAKLWFKNAVWGAALLVGLAEIGFVIFDRYLLELPTDYELIILSFIWVEALTVIPISIFSRYLRRKLVSTFGHDLQLLKAVLLGTIVGMLSPYLYCLWFFAFAPLDAYMVGEKQVDWIPFIDGILVILLTLIPFFMVIMTTIGGLIGFGIGKMTAVKKEN